MVLTNGQLSALQLFCSGENLLLLGDSGTGKSTLISAFVQQAEQSGKRVAKTASTGIAAQLIGGRTIHSLLRAYPGVRNEKIDYKEKAKNLDDVDVLIIDEISMLGQFFVQYLHNCLNCASHHVQLVMSGDFFQLPPVKDEYAFLSPYWKLLNLIPYNGQYYHMDVQVNCMGAGADAIYLSATHPCTYDQSAYPQVSGTDAQVTRFAEGQGDYAAAAQNITVAAFPSEDAFILNIESEKTEEMSTVDYGVCQAIKLPDDVGSIKLDASSPYNEADYEMQVAIIALKGNESRQQGGLYLAQEGPQTNFQTLKKGQSVSLDPLGQGRSAAEIAKYCRENDIFFKFIIFDGRAYRKQEQEKGSVVIQDFGNAIPAMTQYFTY